MSEECQHAIPEEPTGFTVIEHQDWDVSTYVQRLQTEIDRKIASAEVYAKQIYRKRVELARGQGDLAKTIRQAAERYAAMAKDLEEL